MGLKKSKVKFVKQTGEEVSRIKNVKKVIIHYDLIDENYQLPIETIFEDYSSEEAKAKGASPETSSQISRADLTNEKYAKVLGEGSDLIWELNFQSPSIMDYSELDENGKMVGKMKSLKDLGAEIVEV